MAKEKKKHTDYKVSPEAFVVAWNSCETAHEVAKKTGMPVPIVHARASNYRKAGITLKKLARGGEGKRLDISALNALASKTAKR